MINMENELPPEHSEQSRGLAPAKSDLIDPLSSAPASPPASPLVDVRAFVLAGKAIFTLVGRDSRYTYKVTHKAAALGSPYPDAYFISLLTGPDNTSEYTYLGLLDAHTGSVRLTRKSAYTDDTTPVVAIRWALARVWQGKSLPAPAQILHAGRCGRCGRLLTVPSSILSGFGPECAGKL